MAAINKVNVTETIIEGRIDAEYFHPKYHNLDLTLHSFEKKDKLGTLSNFIKKGIFDINPKKYRNSGIPLIRTTQIKSLVSNKDNLIYIDFEEHKHNQIKTELLAGDIIFTKIGAGIGDVAILSSEFPVYNFSQNVAGASIKRDKINPYYLIAFLSSFYGKGQIMRYMMPSGQGKLELKDIKKIQIFRSNFENEISELIFTSEIMTLKSENLYQQATDLLNKELGLNDIVFENKKSYTARFSEVVSNRMDAEFFNQELLNYYSFFKESGKELIPITELTKVLKFSNPDYSKEGAPIITQRHLSSISPENYGDFPIASLEWLKKNPTAVIREDDLLFYSVGAYLGKTNIWFNKDQAVHASFITMLRCQNSFDAGYLMVLLNSKFGILQSKVYQSGSSQPYIYPKDIKQFLVPQINDELKMELYRLIKDSFNAKRESKRLLEQAKLRVEQLIEEAANKQ